MSFDRMLRDVVQEEVAKALAPLEAAIERLEQGSALTARLASALGAPLRRGPGRPSGSRNVKRGPGRPRKDKRPCSIIGCRRPARSKGFCSAHYQKRRMLLATHRLPADWKDDAPPASVKDLKLPRGRAGAKLLAESRKKKA
jgi:hypothetical protein